jgi:hypothetical protein
MKLALLWIAPILLSACYYRVYVNKELVYKGPGVNSKWLKANDSFLVVGKSEQMPDSAVLIEKTVASYLWERSLPATNHALVDLLKPEAQKTRANLIRIIWASNAILPDSIIAWLYYVKESCKTRYIRRLDSIRLSHPDSSIVHVVNLNPRDTFRIYFRDSLIGYCPAPARESRPLLVEPCTYTFANSGHLGFGNPRPYGWYLRKTPVTKGKEYFLFIYHLSSHGYWQYWLTEKSYYW